MSEDAPGGDLWLTHWGVSTNAALCFGSNSTSYPRSWSGDATTLLALGGLGVRVERLSALLPVLPAPPSLRAVGLPAAAHVSCASPVSRPPCALSASASLRAVHL